MQSQGSIQGDLASFGGAPLHRFGQNFMVDANLATAIVENSGAGAQDWVIEVGPGTGVLTEPLLKRCERLLAVEIDHGLCRLLRTRLAAATNFELCEGDALDGKHALNPRILSFYAEAKAASRRVVLVANLPYNVASPILVGALALGVSECCVTVQKEVGERFQAGASEDPYGALSIMIQSMAEVKIARKIPCEVFWPRPGVESVLVHLRRREDSPISDANLREFREFLQHFFGARRKSIGQRLRQLGLPAGMPGLPEGSLRPEDISPADFLRVYHLWKETKRG